MEFLTLINTKQLVFFCSYPPYLLRKVFYATLSTTVLPHHIPINTISVMLRHDYPLSIPYNLCFTFIQTFPVIRNYYTRLRIHFLPLSTPIYLGKALMQPYPQLLSHATPLSIPYQLCYGIVYPYPHYLTSVYLPPIHTYLLREGTYVYLSEPVLPCHTTIQTISVMLGLDLPLSILNI